MATGLAMEKQPTTMNEDAFPIKNGDFSIVMSVFLGVLLKKVTTPDNGGIPTPFSRKCLV